MDVAVQLLPTLLLIKGIHRIFFAYLWLSVTKGTRNRTMEWVFSLRFSCFLSRECYDRSKKSGHDSSVNGQAPNWTTAVVHLHCLQLWVLTSLIPVAIQHVLLMSKGSRSQRLNNNHLVSRFRIDTEASLLAPTILVAWNLQAGLASLMPLHSN